MRISKNRPRRRAASKRASSPNNRNQRKNSNRPTSRHSPNNYEPGLLLEHPRVGDVPVSGVTALEAAPFGGPIYKPLHVIAVFPGEVKKLARREIVCFFS